MFKVIVFDFDYTLGDSTNGIVLSINYALEQLGYSPKSTDEIKKTIGLSLKDTYFHLTENQNSKESEQFAKFFKEKADKVMVENTSLYEGVKDTLMNLRDNGYTCAIVTTKFHYRIEQILNKHNASDLIDVIVGAEDVKVEKPNPEGLLWLVNYLSAEKTDILYIGDSVVDAQTAENANVKFAAVLTGTTSRADFENYSNICIGENVPDVTKKILNL